MSGIYKLHRQAELSGGTHFILNDGKVRLDEPSGNIHLVNSAPFYGGGQGFVVTSDLGQTIGNSSMVVKPEGGFINFGVKCEQCKRSYSHDSTGKYILATMPNFQTCNKCKETLCQACWNENSVFVVNGNAGICQGCLMNKKK